MQELIASVSRGVPTALREVVTLGRTLARRAADVLAYFDRPGTSNGPTEAINGRLEHLRGSALGFRNLTNYIARSLLETGGFRPNYTLDREERPNCHVSGRAPADAVACHCCPASPHRARASMVSRSAAPRSVRAYASTLWASGTRYRMPAACSSRSRLARMFVGAPSSRWRSP
jgi:hypothetical protein